MPPSGPMGGPCGKLPLEREAQMWDDLATRAIYHTNRLEGSRSPVRRRRIEGMSNRMCYNLLIGSGRRAMTEFTITQILDDLRAADEITRRFERRYWLSSADFYELYRQGRLDDGEHSEDFAEWSAYYQIKLDREAALQKLSSERVRELSTNAGEIVTIDPREPSLRLPSAV